MRLFIRIAVAAVMAAGSLAVQAQAQRPPAESPPLLRARDARLPIVLSRVQVDAQVVGLAAQTRVEMEFRNPNDRMLEGELQFPLQPGQTVTGMALDIDGELRAAVPVDKAKGRQVFEDVTRTRVDPALLESTGGNNYKLRIYPLPARGSRRVVLELSETLAATPTARGVTAATYVLPLAFAMPVRRLDVALAVHGYRGASATWGQLEAQRLDAQAAADGSTTLRFSRMDHEGRAPLRIALRTDAAAPQIVTQEFRDGTYFYAEVPLALAAAPRPAPRTVGIVWDASGSGAGRDLGRELALLDRFFATVRDVAVELLVVRDTAEAPRRFEVRGADWTGLRDHLKGLAYDGATRLDLMVAPASSDLTLLFSDGLGTYGERGLPAAIAPLYAISSSVAADHARLRQAAEASGGVLLDLARSSPAEAAGELRVQRPHLAGLEAIGATELVAESRHPQQGRLAIAGRLQEARAEVVLRLQGADGKNIIRRIAVSAPSARANGQPGLGVAAHRWAALTLTALEAEREQNQQAIRRLGAGFGLVTSGTSLIVLDAVADYARHEIEPPPTLRAAYEQLLAQQRTRTVATREAHLAGIARRFAEKQAWWEKDFPREPPPVAAAQKSKDSQAALGARAVPAPFAPAPSAPPAAMMQEAAGRSRDAKADAGGGRQAEATASIALKKWSPDSPYARRLRDASPDAMYRIYLDERPAYTSSTAFFLDAADVFFERGHPLLARRILSNLAEMDLENRHILRILAYRLLQAGQVKDALPLLRKVVALSPDEPQSYRDLGLALAADGQEQQAVRQLWEVVSRPWNNRFPDIELIALAELNATVAKVAATGRTLDTSFIDTRLLRNLPLDLRVVLAWDADNTDIDLWVVDPDGQEAYFGRALTWQGGRMSRDFTGGYGPEEFSLHRAKPGKYTVKAHFFGHRQQVVAPATTLMLRLSTGFGTPGQKDADTVLRLSGAGQEVIVGTFEVMGQP